MIIVLFHVLYIFGKYVYEKYHLNRKKPLNALPKTYGWTDPESPDAYRVDDAEVVMKFNPPAYIQRYVAVQEVLSNPIFEGKLRKVIDYGCSELGFLVHLKRTAGITEILCIDVDRSLLEDNIAKIEPLSAEYLNSRSTPLLIEVYEGSVTDRDKRLEKTDAVICIELIEHLYPDTLMELPFNIFGYIKPKLAVITTPNADFNVLFPHLSKFRHYDHKFEWTRQQFQDWAENIVQRYPDYNVTFHGICKGPPGTEHLGSCTQMAVFQCINDNDNIPMDNIPIFGREGLLKLVKSQEYPYRMDNRSDEQKILDEAVYHIRRLSYSDEELAEEIPLGYLLHLLKKCNISLESLRTILVDGGWVVTDHEDGPAVLIPPASTYSENSIIENEFWNDDSDDIESDTSDAWNREPGPPVDYVTINDPEAEQFFNNWYAEINQVSPENNETFTDPEPERVFNNLYAENWDDESSIVIPHNHPVDRDNTYLFDSENHMAEYSQFQQENVSSSSSNRHVNVGDLNYSSETTVPDVSNSQNVQDNTDRFDANFTSSSVDHVPENLEEQVSNLHDISFSPIKGTDVQDSVDSSFDSASTSKNSVIHSNASTSTINSLQNTSIDSVTAYVNKRRISRVLEFQPHISAMRSSTSPQPPLSDSICLNNLACNDSITDIENDPMHQSMLNNTFRNFDMSTLTQENGIESNITPTRFVNENKNTDNNFETTADLYDINLAEQRLDENILDKSTEKNLNNDQCKDQCNTLSLASHDSCIFNNLPQYASSPRVDMKSVKMKDTEAMNKQMSYGETDHDVLEPFETEKLVLSNKAQDIDADTSTAMHKSSVDSKNSDIKHEVQEHIHPTKDVNQYLDEALNIENTLRFIRQTETHLDLLDKQDTSTTESVTSSFINSQIKMDQNECKIGNRDKIDLSKTISNAADEKSQEVSLKSTTDASTNERAKESSTLTSNTKQETLTDTTLPKSKNEETEHAQDICAKRENMVLTDVQEKIENVEAKGHSPEALETPPNSWSPEIMDSGYPNTASVQDITPEYDLSSIAQDHISDSESPSVAEAPRAGFVEVVEVENGDLANNNRDGEGNNMIPPEINELENLQPLIDVLENDMENENDIYVMENGFPIWLLRILEMPNPVDFEAHHELRVLGPPEIAQEQDGGGARVEQDEGFKSSSSENDSDMDDNVIEMENNIDDGNDSENDNGNHNDDKAENNIGFANKAGSFQT